MSNLPLALSGLRELIDNAPATVGGTRSQIRLHLVSWLKTQAGFDNIEEQLGGTGALDLIIDLVSSGAEVNNFIALRSKQESHLKTAQIPAEIDNNSADLGYRVNRPNSPSFIVKYIGPTTQTLSANSVLGTYGTQSIVYFGDSILIESGDILTGYVGTPKTVSHGFSRTDTSPIEVTIKPEVESGIANTLVQLLYDGKVRDRSLYPEDYHVNRQYADFTEGRVNARILIADLVNIYGIAEEIASGTSDSVTLRYLETSGRDASLSVNAAVLIDGFRILGIGSLGTDPDGDDLIKRDASLMYSLQRRAVSELDYKILLRNQPHFKDVGIAIFDGETSIDRLDINVVEFAIYSITVNGTNFTYQNLTLTSKGSITQVMYEQLKSFGSINVSLEYVADQPDKILIEGKASRLPVIITSSANITPQSIRTRVEPQSSALTAHYSTATGLPITPAEMAVVESVVTKQETFGNTIIYTLANPFELILNLTIRLSASADLALVQPLVNKFIDALDNSVDLVIDTAEVADAIRNYCNNKFNTTVVESIIDNAPHSIRVAVDRYVDLQPTLTYV